MRVLVTRHFTGKTAWMNSLTDYTGSDKVTKHPGSG
jgi:hypothetical protein